MEALSTSIILPSFQESHSSNRHPSLKPTLLFSKTTARLSVVTAAASRKVSGDSEDDQQQVLLDLHNAFDGVIGKTNSNDDLNKKTSEDGKKGVIGQTNSNEDLNKKTSEVGSTRAGLFRTPISGGVQSATSVHDLPKPALAVRNLMEQARFAHLSTVMSRMHQRSEGYPFGSLVDFAPDPLGHPIFSFSQLGIHTRNLLANPRCTLVVQIPGWSGLSNARVTIFGDVYPLAEDEQEWAHKQYIAKHQQAPTQKWGNFYYFRMHNISDIYFIGGFGTVAWVNVKEYEALQPDDIAVNGGEQNLKELNVMFSKPLKDLFSLESQVDDVSLISIDSKGTDIRVRQGAQGVIGKTNSNDDLNKKKSEDGKKGVIGQTNSNEDLNKKTSEVGSTRAGLFRTPISGGVQSATSVHDLPKPALAVRNLMEQARFAHLSTVMSRMHQRSEGYPFGSLVDFAPDPLGHPIFSFSQLGIHTRNLLANPRCTLVVQIPGWSGLSNARVTIFGDVYPLAEDEQEWAHKQYIAKHQQAPTQKWGNFYYFRMHNISDIYFIGGFGTVAWVNVKEYEALQPDDIAVNGGEQNLKELNVMFSKPLKDLFSLESQVDDVSLISIDSKGTDIRVRQGAQFHIQRLVYEEWDGIKTLEEAKAALWNLLNKGGVYTVHK